VLRDHAIDDVDLIDRLGDGGSGALVRLGGRDVDGPELSADAASLESRMSVMIDGCDTLMSSLSISPAAFSRTAQG
jgi:hypothetical protein